MNWLYTQMALLDAATAAVGFGVNWFLQSTLLIIFGLLAGRLLKRRGAAVQSAVYRTTLAAVLICPIASWMLSLAGVSGWSLAMPQPWTYEQAETLVARAASPSPGLPATSPRPVVVTVVPARSSGESDVPVQLSEPGTPDVAASQGIGPLEADIRSPVVIQPTIPEPEAEKADIWTFSIHTLGFVALGVGAAWLFISAALFARLATAWWLLSGLRRRAVPADATTVRICRELAARLGVAAPEVLCSPYLPSPCLVGLRRPAVLLPEVELSLSVRDVLIHELAHSLRRDCHWNLLRQLALSAFFFQPLLWKLSRRLETTAEEVCDDYVVEHGGNRQEYAHCLVDVAELSTAPMAAAGVGIVSLRSMLAQRVQRIMDTSRSLSTRVGSLLLTLVLAAGLVGTAIVGLVGIGPQRSVAEVATAPGEDESSDADHETKDHVATAEAKISAVDDDLITVRGRVLDPAGKPIDGATVRLVRWYWNPHIEHKPLNEAKSDQAGRFEITYRKSQFDVDVKRPQQWKEVAVGAFKQGYGPDWVWWDKVPQGEQAELRLPIDKVPITGRVIDLEGRPLAGVRVECGGLHAPKGDDLSAWIEAVKLGEPPWTAIHHLRDSGLPSEGTGLAGEVTTDTDGRFRLTGIGNERTISLVFEGSTIARTSATAVTRHMLPIEQRITTHRENSDKLPVVGADFVLTLPPTRVIEGVVRDAANGQILKGVGVQSWRCLGSNFAGERQLRAVSDEQGRFRLVGMPKGTENEIVAIPNDDQPYFMRVAKVPDEPGLAPVTVDFELHRGIWITGRVTNQLTGKPVRTARLNYLPFLSNEYAQALPEFANGNVAGTNAYQDRYETAADGSYRLVGLPGRAIIGVLAIDDYRQGLGAAEIEGMDEKGQFQTYRNPLTASKNWPTAVKEVNPAVGVASVEVDFELDPGKQVEITTLDPTGQPIAGVNVTGMTPNVYQLPTTSPTFTATAFGPEEERMILLHHEKRGLGKAIRARADEPEKKITVRLEACAKIRGRLVDQNQVPITGAQIRIDVQPSADFSEHLPLTTTDAEGRFEHTAVLPGVSYAVMAEGAQFGFRAIAKEVSIEPGETIDLGTIDITSDERPAPVRTKAAANVNASASGAKSSEGKTTQGDQGATDDAVAADTKGDANALVIRGTVLDPDGKQFSGADVQLAGTPRAAWAKDFPIPKARSDASGRFAFELPKSLYDGIGTVHPWPFALIVANAPGYAPAYVPYEADSAGTQPSIRLAANAPIEGRIVDLEGRPVPGVQVRVMSIRTNVESDPTAWLEAIRKGTPHAAVPEASQLNMGLSSDVDQPGNKTQSDAEGRFRITAVGRGRLATLRISGGGIVSSDLEAVNWPMEPLTTDVASSGTAILKTFFGARFQFAAEPSQPIEGIVRDAASGEPLAGVSVLNMKLAGWPARYYSGMDEAVSDQHGKYRLEGMPKGKGNEVFAMPADGQPYFMRNFEVPTAPAFEPVRLDLELHRGMLIHGVVRDKDSGEPISATVIYLPWPDNPHIAGLPEFNSRVLAGHDERYRTNAEGRFTLVGLPGRGLLSVIRVDDQPYPRGQGFDQIPDLGANAERFKSISQLYMPNRDFIIAVKHVQPAEDQAEFSTVIELEQGGSVKLTVVDEAGAAVSGATVGGIWPKPLSHVELNSAPVIAALGLKPGEKRWVVGCHVQRNLGGVVQVGLDDDRAGPVPFVLRPNGRIQGRLLDGQGKPLHGVQLSFQIAGLDVWRAAPGPVRTDVDGRFVNNMVFPGGSYDVKFETDPGRTKSLAKGLAVEPGETIDLGTIDSTSDERPAPVRTKAAANVNASASGAKSDERSTAAGDEAAQADAVQVFEGQVVDPTGKPVEHAELYFVYHIPPPRGLLVPIWKPVATTDAKGAFRFTARPTDFGMHSSAREFGYAALIAVKDGFGFAWSQASKHETSGKWLGDARARVKDTPAELVEQMKRMLSGVGEPLKLVVDDQPIRGRIVDIDGRPVSGARLTLLAVWSEMGDDLAGWRAAAKEPKADYYSARMKTIRLINGPQVRSLVKPAVTGDDGQFTLRGVGRGRIAELLVEGPGIESAKIFARTEAGEKIELMRERRSPELGSYIYYPAELVHVAGPSAAIAGVVRDAETKVPLSGVTVKSQSRHGERINGWGQDFVRAVTDAEGRYRLEGMPIGSDNRIAAIAPLGDIPYLSMSKDAATSNQESTPEIDFDLRVGVWLEGRIVDKRTGKGLTGRLDYFVKKGSPNYGFARSLRVDERDRLLSDNEGRFRIAALPGPGYVTFSADDHENYPRAAAIVMHDGSRKKIEPTLLATEPFQLATSNYHVVTEVDPATDAKRVELNLELDGGNNVIGHVVDQDGKPVTGFYYSGQMALFDDWRQSVGDKFELKDYHPESPRRAFFSYSERNLAASAIVQGALPESLVVKLEPAGRVKGRLVDQDGSPLANCELVSWLPPLGSPADSDSVHRAPPLPHNRAEWQHGRYETDEKGRFEISCLVPGLEYRLRAFDRASMTPAGGQTQRTLGPLDVIVRVEPGESKDLGDVRLADEATFAAAASQAKKELPALPAQPHAVLRGQITLAGGNPVAEAHVAVIAMRIQHPRGGDLSPDGQVLAEGITDSSGKYRLNFAGANSKTHRYANVIARKDGYAVAWHPLNIDAEATEVSFELAPEEPIRGRLVDIEGQPASGVRLLMRSVMKKSADGMPVQQGAGYHGGDDVPLAWLQPVTSDVEGRFTLSGVPAGHGVFLDVAGSERFAPQEIALNTGMPKQRGERDGTYRPLVEDAAPGDEATLPLAPAQLFEGLVTYEDTGKPAGHARLTIWASQQQHGSMASVAGNADEQGRYRISPHPGIRFGINAYPADGTAYLARQTALSPGIEWQTGDRVKHVDIQLPRGVLVRGSVLESGTNVPVAGASIQYIPEEANNPHAADHILTGWQGIKLSDEQGKFQIAVLPGPGRLLIHGPSEKYVLQEVSESELNRGKPGGRRNYAHAIERIEPASGADPIDVTVQIKAGATVAGRLVDELGNPIDEALVISRLFVLPHSPWWRGYGDVPPPTLGGKFELSGLGQDQEYAVYFLDAKRRLGATQMLRADSKDLTVVLQPCGQASARFVDSQGQPHVGFSPGLHIVITPGEHEHDYAAAKLGKLAADADFVANVDRMNYWPGPKTDEQGRVTFPALIPGATYRLETYKDGKPQVLEQFSVKSGESKDLGDVRLADEATMTAAAKQVKAKPPAATVQPAAKDGPQPKEAAKREPASSHADEAIPVEDDPAVPARIQLFGKVVRPDGNPAAGANVYLLQESPMGTDAVAVVATDADGGFAFDVGKDAFNVDETSEPWLIAKVLAKADGLGPAWALAASFEPSGKMAKNLPLYPSLTSRRAELVADQTLRLVTDDVPIEGRIVSIEGHPIAGARVRVMGIDRTGQPTLDSWLTAVENPLTAFEKAWGHLPVSTGFNFRREIERLFPDITSDSDGRFRIVGVGRESIVGLQIEGPGIETRQVSARTRKGETLRITDRRFRTEQAKMIHGSNFDHVAGPSRPVKGVVRDKDTHQPLAGVKVQAYRLAGIGVQPYPNAMFYTLTDTEGRYQLDGLPVGDNKLLAIGPASEPYIVSALPAEVNPDQTETTVDFALKRGVWIRGRVSDASDGRPLRANVYYAVFLDNARRREAPGYSDAFSLWYPTDADGRFQIPGFIGRGIVGVRATNYSDYPRGVGADRIEGRETNHGYTDFRTEPSFGWAENYHAVAAVTPDENGANNECNFALVPGRKISGNLFDSAGDPLTGAMILGAVEASVWQPLEDASFAVRNVDPLKPRRVQFLHSERKLAGSVMVKGDEAGPISVKLEPWATITGRILDDTGNPLPSASLTSDVGDKQLLGVMPGQFDFAADAEGRFKIEGLAPHLLYNLSVMVPQRYLGVVVKDLQLSPGETKDLGELSVKRPSN